MFYCWTAGEETAAAWLKAHLEGCKGRTGRLMAIRCSLGLSTFFKDWHKYLQKSIYHHTHRYQLVIDLLSVCLQIIRRSLFTPTFRMISIRGTVHGGLPTATWDVSANWPRCGLGWALLTSQVQDQQAIPVCIHGVNRVGCMFLMQIRSSLAGVWHTRHTQRTSIAHKSLKWTAIIIIKLPNHRNRRGLT